MEQRIDLSPRQARFLSGLKSDQDAAQQRYLTAVTTIVMGSDVEAGSVADVKLDGPQPHLLLETTKEGED